jgi:hypothetical protein
VYEQELDVLRNQRKRNRPGCNSYQTRRIAVECSEEKEAHLVLLRRNQQQRIATESAEEREGLTTLRMNHVLPAHVSG